MSVQIETGFDPMAMVKQMFGTGIQIVDASFQGDPLSAGIYTTSDGLAQGVAPSGQGIILSTGHASSLINQSGPNNQLTGTTKDTNGIDGDAGLTALAGIPTFDAAILSASFIPSGSVLTMQISFSSEEYMEYVNSGFNDVVGIWVNGEKALLTVGDGDISIDNISAKTNSDLYIDNASGAHATEMDGFTVTLTLKALVNPGVLNTIRIGIADGGDSAYDSNLMIAGHSVQTAVVATDDTFDIGRKDETTLNLTGNDSDISGTGLFITQINGVPVTAGSQVMLPSGVLIRVNGDGTITLVTDGDETAGATAFSYEVTNGNGISDVGFVQGQIACFVAGAQIATEQGMISVEALRVGDRVFTLDHGLQTLRWVGRRTVASIGAHAAVSIPADTFGTHDGLRVSPQHRILLTGWQTELLCGTDEVLVKAIHLVEAGLLRQDCSGCPVTYCHLLFDRHEIINAAGLWSESYLPGPQTMAGHDARAHAELCSLFPALELDPASYGPAARTEADARAGFLLGQI